MFYFLILIVVAATALVLLRHLLVPAREYLHLAPARIRGALGLQTMADLQRQAAAEISRRALVSISARHLPNDVLILLHPDDRSRLASLESAFSDGVAELMDAAVRNGDDSDGLPYVLLGKPKIRLDQDVRIARGTVGVICAILDETACLRPRSVDRPPWSLQIENREVPLQGELLLGRSPRADIQVNAAGVSREHALITCHGSHITVRDLGGRNGTQVNGRPIEEAEIHSGDTISFGPRAEATLKTSLPIPSLTDLTTAPLAD
jgi:hypothetical protein